MDPESIAVAPSVDSGNVSVETEPTEPTEPTPTETPAEIVETVPEPEKYKLPDGREVTGEELYKEHVENLLPEFTKRSQELAALKSGENLNNKPTSPAEDPDYVPTSYAEIIKLAKEEAIKEWEGKETARAEQSKAIETAVVNTLTELKKADPSLDENKLFLHANKYGFTDLKVAHQNMKDMSELAKTVQQTTVKNIAKRSDPVSVSPGATGAKPNPAQFNTAGEYLAAVKASGK